MSFPRDTSSLYPFARAGSLRAGTGHRTLLPPGVTGVPDSAPVAPPSSELKQDELTRRVLVVEDDETLARSLRRAFTRDGHEVLRAPTAEQAIQILVSEVFDVILVDLNLPRRHGDSFIGMARALGCRAPILVMTAYGNPETLERLRTYDVEKVIPKDADFMTNIRQGVRDLLLGTILGAEPQMYWVRRSREDAPGLMQLRILRDLVADGLLTNMEVSLDGVCWLPLTELPGIEDAVPDVSVHLETTD